MGDRRTKVDLLNAGRSHIRHINSDSIAPLRATGRLCATVDFSRIAKSNAVILCIPTPLTRQRKPDLSFVARRRPKRSRAICDRDS